jgi:hypothetical protein
MQDIVIALGDGEYLGAGNRDITIDPRLILIVSRSGNQSACVINPQGSAGNQRRAFRFTSGTNEHCRIEGVGFRGGYETGSNYGSAVWCDQGSPVFRDCRFFANGGTNGAVAVTGGGDPTFFSCEFWDNTTSAVLASQS